MVATVCGGPEGEPCTGKWWTMWIWMRDAGMVLRLDTNWKVFSTRPPTQDWWCVFPAKLNNDQTVDIFTALHGGQHLQEPFASVMHDPPAAPAYTLRDERWTKYFETVTKGWSNDIEERQQKEFRKWLGQYLCREWNGRHGRASEHGLVSFEMNIHFVDNSVVYAQRPAAGPPINMWSHIC